MAACMACRFDRILQQISHDAYELQFQVFIHKTRAALCSGQVFSIDSLVSPGVRVGHQDRRQAASGNSPSVDAPARDTAMSAAASAAPICSCR